MNTEITIYSYPKAIHEIALNLIQTDIYLNQTYLVEQSLQKGIFGLTDLFNRLNPEGEPQEIFEWWSVSEFMADQLRAIMEPVLSNAYGIWWGRTCTGQSIIHDGTIQEVVKRIDAQL